jgi:flagellar biosynthesis protein
MKHRRFRPPTIQTSPSGMDHAPMPKDRQKAVALSYDSEKMPAPTLSASGEGLVAERIIALAKANGIPIREDPELVTLLSQLDVGQVIPPELYNVVAELLAFVYRLKGKVHSTEQRIAGASSNRLHTHRYHRE